MSIADHGDGKRLPLTIAVITAAALHKALRLE
jgi:hypothetical protein